MTIKLSKNDFKQLMKETIEDVALANAIDKGIETKPVLPSININTNLVYKTKVEFHASFFSDFDEVSDRREKDCITKLISELSQGRGLAKLKKVITKDHGNYFRIASDDRFVCLKITESKIAFVRVIHKKEITQNFVGNYKQQKVK